LGNVRPTIELTERTPTTCRLGAEEVEFLLARHRRHIALVPSREPGCYRLTPGGHVGAFLTPGHRFLIRPKIPLKNVRFLLDPTTPVTVGDDEGLAAPGVELLDLLAVRLAVLMDERAAAGLHRAYVERVAHGPLLQGRLDLAAQMRNAAGARDKVHCRYEEFTADVSCNQLPKATAELVVRSPLLGETARQALAGSLRSFGPVQSVPLGPESFADVAADRLTAAYQPLLDLCRLLVEGLGPTANAGPTPGPAFLLDMERVFENYVTRALSEALGAYQINIQPLWQMRPIQETGPPLTMRPDLTLHRDGQPLAVVDAKWKRSSKVRADLYQILGYCAARGFPCGILIYPGRHDRAWDYELAEGGVRLRILTLRVVGSRAACERSRGRLLSAVLRKNSVC
jgi:5-methylcytosine-specific restriction enzyme subunit McrC